MSRGQSYPFKSSKYWFSKSFIKFWEKDNTGCESKILKPKGPTLESLFFAAYRGTSLRSWLQKKCLLPGGIWIFFPKNLRFWKFKLDFFPLKKVFEIFWQNTMNKRLLNYLWPKFQEICGRFFFHKIPPILKVEVGFFSDRKSFSQNG